MMKKFNIAAAIFILALIGSSASASPSEKFHISLGLGLTFPAGYINEKYELGYNYAIEIDFDLHKNIRLFALANYAEFSWDLRDAGANITASEGVEFISYSIFLGIKGTWNVFDRLTLCGLGGGGLCVQNTEDIHIWQREPGPAGGYKEIHTTIYNKLREGALPGIMTGIGMEYRLSRLLFLMVDGLFVIIFNKEQAPPEEWAWLPPEIYKNPPNVSFFPIRIGIGFNF